MRQWFRRDVDAEVDRRVAETVLKIDPFEVLMKRFNGIFSKEHERVEDPLDAKGQLLMRTWAWQNREHPAFKYLTEWIMNTQANETLKHAPVTEERILYGRAQISGMLLFVREVERLALAYEDMLARKPDDDFDASDAV